MDVRTLCLAALREGEATPAEMRKRIAVLFGPDAVPGSGSLYPALARLEAQGAIDTRERGGKGASLERRVFAITTDGLSRLVTAVAATDGRETRRSAFTAAMALADLLEPDDIHHLMTARLAALRAEERHYQKALREVRNEGHRLALRYALALSRAGIAFLEGEGRAIAAAAARQTDPA